MLRNLKVLSVKNGHSGITPQFFLSHREEAQSFAVVLLVLKNCANEADPKVLVNARG